MLGQQQLLLNYKKTLVMIAVLFLAVTIFAEPVLWNNEFQLPEFILEKIGLRLFPP